MGTGGAVGRRDLPAVRWLEGSEGLSVARRTLAETGGRASLSAAPSPSPPPHPRRCHGFPLLSGSGAELQSARELHRRLLRHQAWTRAREGRGTASLGRGGTLPSLRFAAPNSGRGELGGKLRLRGWDQSAHLRPR